MNTYNKPQNVDIAYFSGTGGTKLAALSLSDSLKDRSINVNAIELNSKTSADNGKADMIIILFPVYAANAPQPIYDYIEKLPKAENIPAAVISVPGGGDVFPNKGCRIHTIKRLTDKGYVTVYEDMLVMPANFLTPTPDELSVFLIKALPLKTKRIAGDIASGVLKPAKPGIADKAVSSLLELQKKGGKQFGNKIITGSSCNGCGLCANSCPSGNIEMKNGKPEYKSSCLMCMKCLYNCPQKALKPGVAKFMVLKSGFNINKLKILSDETPNDSINSDRIKVLTHNLAFSGL